MTASWSRRWLAQPCASGTSTRSRVAKSAISCPSNNYSHKIINHTWIVEDMGQFRCRPFQIILSADIHSHESGRDVLIKTKLIQKSLKRILTIIVLSGASRTPPTCVSIWNYSRAQEGHSVATPLKHKVWIRPFVHLKKLWVDSRHLRVRRRSTR